MGMEGEGIGGEHTARLHESDFLPVMVDGGRGGAAGSEAAHSRHSNAAVRPAAVE